MTANPSQDGFFGRAANCFRSCQTTKAEKAGTRNPCEKFGSVHQSAGQPR